MGPLKSLNCRKYNITLTDILVVLKLEGCVNTTIPSESCGILFLVSPVGQQISQSFCGLLSWKMIITLYIGGLEISLQNNLSIIWLLGKQQRFRPQISLILLSFV